jgi:hypothetical protein
VVVVSLTTGGQMRRNRRAARVAQACYRELSSRTTEAKRDVPVSTRKISVFLTGIATVLGPCMLYVGYVHTYVLPSFNNYIAANRAAGSEYEIVSQSIHLSIHPSDPVDEVDGRG